MSNHPKQTRQSLVVHLVVIDNHSNSNGDATLGILRSDNFCYVSGLPTKLLPRLTRHTLVRARLTRPLITISVSTHGLPDRLSQFPRLLRRIHDQRVRYSILCLSTSRRALLGHFSRAHHHRPLDGTGHSLTRTVTSRAGLLRPVTSLTSLGLGAAGLGLCRLHSALGLHLLGRPRPNATFLIRSFNFGHNVPISTSLMFSIHYLPGPC